MRTSKKAQLKQLTDKISNMLLGTDGCNGLPFEVALGAAMDAFSTRSYEMAISKKRKKIDDLSQWLLDNVFFSTSEQPPTLPAPVEGLSYADMAAAWSLATWQCCQCTLGLPKNHV